MVVSKDEIESTWNDSCYFPQIGSEAESRHNEIFKGVGHSKNGKTVPCYTNSPPIHSFVAVNKYLQTSITMSAMLMTLYLKEERM